MKEPANDQQIAFQLGFPETTCLAKLVNTSHALEARNRQAGSTTNPPLILHWIHSFCQVLGSSSHHAGGGMGSEA